MSGEPDRLDAPNQQVVRGDASGPAVEGTGGSQRAEEEAPKKRGRPPKQKDENEE